MSDAKAPNGLPYVAPFLETNGNVVQLKTLRPKHHAIMDYLLANPRVPYSAVAEEFGVTQAWLSTVINSDIFQNQLRARRALMDDHVNRDIVSRLHNIAKSGLETMEDLLEDEDVSAATKLDITKTSLTALGYLGSRGGSPVTVNVQANTQTTTMNVRSAILQETRDRMNKEASDRQASRAPVVIDQKPD